MGDKPCNCPLHTQKRTVKQALERIEQIARDYLYFIMYERVREDINIIKEFIDYLRPGE